METGNGTGARLTAVLTGCRVLVTARRRAEDLGRALEGRGAEVAHVPTSMPVPLPDDTALVRRTRELLARPAPTVVVPTATAFEQWLDAVRRAGLADELLRVLAASRLVVRGPKTRAALQHAGLVPDWVAEADTAAELAAFLVADGVCGQRVAVLHHGGGDGGVGEVLGAAGADVVPLEVYRWGPPPRPDLVGTAVRDLADGRFDAVVFTSAPAAVAWLEAVGAVGVGDAVRELVQRGTLLLAAVGPVTAEPLAFAGFVTRQPSRPRLGSLVQLVVTELGDDRHALLTRHGRLRVRAAAVTLDHVPVPLAPNSLAVLRRLAATPGHVVTREELLRALPGESTDPHTAEVAVARLREALRGDKGLVRTVIKRGYVLAAR